MSHDEATIARVQAATSPRVRAVAVAALVAMAAGVLVACCACGRVQPGANATGETSVTVITSAQGAQPSAQAGATKPGKSGYRLIFDDEFDGRALSASRWVPSLAWGSTNRDEQERYVSRALSVSGGLLTITAQPGPSAGRAYTSGAVNTSGAFAFKYGYAEIRCRVPAGAGLWSAFWLAARGAGVVDEIDALEVIGSDPNRAYAVLHYGTQTDKERTLSSYRGADLSAGFHVFAVDWRADSVTWLIDGVPRFRTTQHVPQLPMYVIANLAVGAPTSWAGAPDARTVFPAHFQIDYIRVYQPR